MSTGKRILMIDDDVNLVDVIRMAFEAKGYEFSAAYSASEGMKKIKQVNPDLIILDVIMEDFVAGFRVVNELRASENNSEYQAYAQTPILMLTSVTARTSFDFSQRVGTSLLPVDAYLDKPVKPGELLSKVKKLLDEAPSDQETET